MKSKFKSPAAFAAVFVSLTVLAASCGKSVIFRGGSQFTEQSLTVNTGDCSGGEGPGGGGGDCNQTAKITCYKDQYTEAEPCHDGPPKLDVLLVIDNGHAMDAYRPAIGAELKKFVKGLPDGIDYRFAAILGHAQDQWAGKLWPGCFNGPLVLRGNELSRDEIGDELAIRLLYGPSEEASAWGHGLFTSVSKSLDPEKADPIRSAGFYRDDAALAVLFVSARNDICYLGSDFPGGAKPTDWEGFAIEEAAKAQNCTGIDSVQLAAKLKTFKGERPVSGAAIVHATADGLEPTGANQPGYSYLKLVQNLGGFGVDIRSGDNVSTKLAKLAELPIETTPLQTAFRLRIESIKLDRPTVEAFVDGKKVTFALDDSMLLTLNPATSGLKPGSVVELNYCSVPELIPGLQ